MPSVNYLSFFDDNQRFVLNLFTFSLTTMRLLWVMDFWCCTNELHKPRHFYGFSPLGTMSDHNLMGLSPWGNLSQLDDTRHIIILYHFLNQCDSLGPCPTNRAHLSTPYAVLIHNHVSMTIHRTPNTVSIPTMHSHPCHAIFSCTCNAIMPLPTYTMLHIK